MRTLIKSGTVVTASDQYRGDVLIEDEKIALIGTEIDVQRAKAAAARVKIRYGA
jgi:dihydropyrimidinase